AMRRRVSRRCASAAAWVSRWLWNVRNESNKPAPHTRRPTRYPTLQASRRHRSAGAIPSFINLREIDEEYQHD
ncbi:hypothetical protein, partial [Caballeronia sp. INDeC2]|uniref:hypothetical protein n=1 Tax=Caballeronia sp. INDeC2 TaxID=2921747 RepID=UPI0032EB4477